VVKSLQVQLETQIFPAGFDVNSCPQDYLRERHASINEEPYDLKELIHLLLFHDVYLDSLLNLNHAKLFIVVFPARHVLSL
jgi:hypothetical protein